MAREKNGVFTKDVSLALKGLAVIMLLFHHSYGKEKLFEKYVIDFYPFEQQAVIDFASSLKICVSIFAFITGYGLYLSFEGNKDDTTKWMTKRYIRTFSGYWIIWILCAIIFQCIDNRYWYTFFKDTEIHTGMMNVFIDFVGLSNLFQTPSLCRTWWYMSAVIIFILFVPLLYRMKNTLIPVLIGTILLPRLLFARNIRYAFTGGTTVLVFLTPFIFGTIFARYNLFDKWINVGRHVWSKLLKFAIEITLIIFGYNMYINLIRDLYWEYHYCFYPMLVILFLVEFVFTFKPIRTVFAFFGTYSMNIFLIHTFILSLYWSDFIYSFGHFALNVLVLFGICLAVSILIEIVKKVTHYNILMNYLTRKI